MAEVRTKIVYAPTEEKLAQGLADGTIDYGDLVVMPEKFIYITSTGELVASTPNKLVEILQANLDKLSDTVEQNRINWVDYTKEEEQ